MARGVISGILVGGAASVLVAGVVSVLAPPPKAPVISETAPGAGVAPQDESPAPEQAATVQETAPTASSGTQQVAAPQPDAVPGIDQNAQRPEAQPSAGGTAELNVPAAPDTTGSRPAASTDGTTRLVGSTAPQTPQGADSLSIDTDPAQPPLPDAPVPEGQFDAPGAPEAEAVAEGAAPQAPAAGTAGDQQIAGAAPQAPQAPQAPAAQPVEGGQPSAPQAEAAEPQETEVAALQPSSRPAIGKPATTLTGRTPSSLIDRENAPETAETGTVAEGPPIRRFAQPFENPENKPLMSLVLIDDGKSPTSGAAGIAALRSFPYPLSFAVDTGLPDAAERVALYRQEGFEVLAMIDLPEGARAADAETNVAALLGGLDQVIGVLEGTAGGLQGSKEVSDQVTAILAQSGHGLVTMDKGLNTMPKLARKAGVPASPIFRDFDSKGQDAVVIRRFLDQAAFRAGQEGAVIMLGRSRPDTISALLLWGLQDRAGTVALSPVSAVLLREE